MKVTFKWYIEKYLALNLDLGHLQRFLTVVLYLLVTSIDILAYRTTSLVN